MKELKIPVSKRLDPVRCLNKLVGGNGLKSKKRPTQRIGADITWCGAIACSVNRSAGVTVCF
ncbi:MAG: hypothetical protein PVH37_00745 [Desulfobacterales bacterium]